LLPMIVRRSEAGTHCVLAIDPEKRLVEEFREVPNSEVADLLKDMRTRLGTNVRILVDGTTIDGESLARGPAAAPRGLTRPPVQILEDKGEEGQVSQIELAPRDDVGHLRSSRTRADMDVGASQRLHPRSTQQQRVGSLASMITRDASAPDASPMTTSRPTPRRPTARRIRGGGRTPRRPRVCSIPSTTEADGKWGPATEDAIQKALQSACAAGSCPAEAADPDIVPSAIAVTLRRRRSATQETAP
jgi:hypothetical protein